MSLLFSYFYDYCMDAAEQACLQQWRKELLRNVSGDVLEIGSGTGANLKYFPSDISSLVLSEPDKNMRKQLQKNITDWPQLTIKISASTAEKIDAKDASFDYVISALVCCSVTNINVTLAEIKRVLKPGGKLIFLEHVAAEAGTKRRQWQHRLNPFWRKLAGNCHLIRETENEIEKAGFTISEITRESMRKAMPVVRPTIRGVAIK